MLKFKKLFSRVDVQVSLLTASIVLCSSILTSVFCYEITYKDAILTLHNRVYALYESIEKYLDKSTFDEINTAEDMKKDIYIESKLLLENAKDTAGVMYLYTAKENSNGDLIYLIDGLDESEDFRVPGDLIEPEIVGHMRKALNGNMVLPDEINVTDWGKIFITYLPVHGDNGEIVGVVGIEFEANHEYDTYNSLKFKILFISLLFCMIAVLISYYVFRRISNPHFKDLSNTDKFTELKNRNAFEIDVINLDAKKAHVGIVAVDLNKLKNVNDTFGHSVGDLYIKLVADTLNQIAKSDMVAYRIGGDEFVVIAIEYSIDEIRSYIEKAVEVIKNQTKYPQIKMSISYGCAVFDPNKDKNLFDTYKRADLKMYVFKKKSYGK